MKPRQRAYKCLECSATSWFTPSEMLHAARPRCGGCGSLMLEYQQSWNGYGGKDKDGKKLKRPHLTKAQRLRRAGVVPFADSSPERQQKIRLKRLQDLHAEFKLRRKYGIALHKPGAPG